MSATQRRILAALDATNSEQVNCLGQLTSPRRYFTDLVLLSYLVRRSWPLARDLAPSPALADVLDAYLTHPQETIRRRPDIAAAGQARRWHSEDRAPPIDAVACAALLTTADRLLTLEAPRTLTLLPGAEDADERGTGDCDVGGVGKPRGRVAGGAFVGVVSRLVGKVPVSRRVLR